MQEALLASWTEPEGSAEIRRLYNFTEPEMGIYLDEFGGAWRWEDHAPRLAATTRSGRRAIFVYEHSQRQPGARALGVSRALFLVRLESPRDDDVPRFDGMDMFIPISSHTRKRLRWFLISVLGLEPPKIHHRRGFQDTHQPLHYPMFLEDPPEPWHGNVLDALEEYQEAAHRKQALDRVVESGPGSKPWKDWVKKHGHLLRHTQLLTSREEDRALILVKQIVEQFLGKYGLEPTASKHRWTDLDAFSYTITSPLIHDVVIEGERSQGQIFFTVTADSLRGTSESHTGPDLLEALRKANVLVSKKDALLWHSEALEAGTLNTPDLSSYSLLGLPSPLLTRDTDFATWWSTAESL